MTGGIAVPQGGVEVNTSPCIRATGPVPSGVAVFAEDIAIRRYAERANNIVHWSDFETGGHFAALETPELLVQDIRVFFASLPA